MSYFASTDRTTGEVGQAEMAEKRRIAEMLKRISDQQAGIATQASIWLRCRDANPKQAGQAMERLLEARAQENALFRQLFGIDDERQAIEKR